MIGFTLRLLWRLTVGAIAVALAYGTFFFAYPYLDKQFPSLIVLVLLYIFAAYVGIPILVRLWKIVFRPHHLPHYATSGDGWSSDPINIAIVCKSEEQLTRIMEDAGWFKADSGNIPNNLRAGAAILFSLPYARAPFSKLYLFGRKHDIGFQIQTGRPRTPRHRHHIRFWQLLPDTPTRKVHQHNSFWDAIFARFSGSKKQIWIGAATHDVGPIAFRVQNLQITHKIDEETNRERDYVIETLRQSNTIRRHEIIKAGEPLKFRGQTFGVSIVTDGTLHVIELK